MYMEIKTHFSCLKCWFINENISFTEIKYLTFFIKAIHRATFKHVTNVTKSKTHVTNLTHTIYSEWSDHIMWCLISLDPGVYCKANYFLMTISVPPSSGVRELCKTNLCILRIETCFFFLFTIFTFKILVSQAHFKTWLNHLKAK